MSKFNRSNIRASKLTPQQVYELRLAYAEGATQGSLAREYGISIGQIGRIVRGESWQHFVPVETRAEAEGAAVEARIIGTDPAEALRLMKLDPSPSEETLAAIAALESDGLGLARLRKEIKKLGPSADEMLNDLKK